MSGQQSFGKLKSFLWPVHRHEVKKLVPMLILFFLITFIYNLLRPTKISLMVMAEGSGTEVIPYLKLWAVLPGAFLITYFFTLVANRFTREQTFYIMLSLFLGYFLLFAGFLYPHREILQLDSFASLLQGILPAGCRGFVSIVRHWNLSIFYVMSELWATIILSMLFWGYANEVSTIEEAKRFYGVFVLASNISGIFCGQVGKALSLKHTVSFLPIGYTAWEQSVVLIVAVAVVLGAIIIGTFAYLNRVVIHAELQQSHAIHNKTVSELQKETPKMHLSLFECFAYLKQSRYLCYLTLIVVSYNIVYNLSEVIWTEEARQIYSNPVDFNAYMNQITSVTGVLSTIMALFVCSKVIRKFGWLTAALISPIIWLFTSLGFFSFFILEEFSLADGIYAFFNSPHNIAIIFGSAQIALGRATKNTVFDETKEIAFIPLSKENQRKGKAVVDGIAGWVGRSGGSIIYQTLLLVCVNIAATIPYVAVMFFIVIGVWIYSVRALGKMVEKNVDENVDQMLEEIIEKELDPASDSAVVTPL